MPQRFLEIFTSVIMKGGSKWAPQSWTSCDKMLVGEHFPLLW